MTIYSHFIIFGQRIVAFLIMFSEHFFNEYSRQPGQNLVHEILMLALYPVNLKSCAKARRFNHPCRLKSSTSIIPLLPLTQGNRSSSSYTLFPSFPSNFPHGLFIRTRCCWMDPRQGCSVLRGSLPPPLMSTKTASASAE